MKKNEFKKAWSAIRADYEIVNSVYCTDLLLDAFFCLSYRCYVKPSIHTRLNIFKSTKIAIPNCEWSGRYLVNTNSLP